MERRLPPAAPSETAPHQPEKQLMDTTVAPPASIGVDIGKEVFHLVGFATDGKIGVPPQD
jgi:hypothetical protein